MIERPVLPFAGIVLLAFAAATLHTAGTEWGLVVGASAAAALIGLLATLLPSWSTRPAALLLLPIAADAVLAVLREAQGGSTSGYSPLAMLPVVWVGLVLGRRAVVAMAICTCALFGLPIAVLGAPMYPSSGVRGVVLWTVVALVVGLIVNRVMDGQRRHATLARVRAGELDRLVRTQTAIGTAAFSLDAVLATAVEEARAITAAEAAVIELPDDEDLVYRAVAGTAGGHLGLRLRRDGSFSGESLRTRRTLVCADSETDVRVDREACRRVGARSMVVVPLPHDDGAAGVLKVYSSQRGAFSDAHAGVLSILASMIGPALARAAHLHTLSNQAITDELTAVANRRHWNEQLDLALARCRRSGQPLSVILLDLDGFKAVNDRHGHAAGDRLLVETADAWSAALRAGDLLGRIGGDEFAVLVEGGGESDAVEVIARLAAARGTAHNASAGAATWDGHEAPETLLARADRHMYDDKRRRNGLAA